MGEKEKGWKERYAEWGAGYSPGGSRNRKKGGCRKGAALALTPFALAAVLALARARGLI